MKRLPCLLLVLAFLGLGLAVPADAQTWCQLCAGDPLKNCFACCRCAGGRPAECAVACEGPDPQPFAPRLQAAAGQCPAAGEPLDGALGGERLGGPAAQAGDAGGAEPRAADRAAAP